MDGCHRMRVDGVSVYVPAVKQIRKIFYYAHTRHRTDEGASAEGSLKCVEYFYDLGRDGIFVRFGLTISNQECG